MQNIISNEFKKAGSKVVCLSPEYDENGLPNTESLLSLFRRVTELMRAGKVLSCYTPGMGGIGAAVMKMAFGNGFGFDFADTVCPKCLFGYEYGSFVMEVTEDVEGARLIGTVTDKGVITRKDESVSLADLQKAYEDKLESVYACNIPDAKIPVETVSSPSCPSSVA